MTRAEIVTALIEKGQTLTTAESCTGGLLAGAITDIAGSSQIFMRGFVTYSNAAKTAMLGVPAAMIERYGAVSEPVAAAMASGACSHGSEPLDIGISTTGIAGPGGSDHKPEGRVCFGLNLTKSGRVMTETVEFGALGRANVREAAVDHALQMLARYAL